MAEEMNSGLPRINSDTLVVREELEHETLDLMISSLVLKPLDHAASFLEV